MSKQTQSTASCPSFLGGLACFFGLWAAFTPEGNEMLGGIGRVIQKEEKVVRFKRGLGVFGIASASGIAVGAGVGAIVFAASGASAPVIAAAASALCMSPLAACLVGVAVIGLVAGLIVAACVVAARNNSKKKAFLEDRNRENDDQVGGFDGCGIQ